jgi:hypothetical protein
MLDVRGRAMHVSTLGTTTANIADIDVTTDHDQSEHMSHHFVGVTNSLTQAT